MRSIFTRMAIPVTLGIAFGFFIGCSTSKQTTVDNGSYSADELEQRLGTIDEQISAHPQRPDNYLQKGDILNILAHRQESPDERSRYYNDMQTALARAKSLFSSESEPGGVEKVNELLRTSWGFEHNRGVEILQTDSTLTESAYNLAASHFNNAIIIIPDSVVSYKLKAQTHYRNHQIGQAIATLESAYSRIDRLPSGVLEQLAFLYLEQDRGEKAVELYEKAESFSDDNLNLIHGLANAYITSGRHEQAVDLLRVMVQNEPENIIYLESYANELYKLGIQKYNSIRSLGSNDTVAVHRLSAQADTLLKRAREQYAKALDLNADNPELRRLLATYHQNYAVQLQRTLSRFPEQEQRVIRIRIENHLTDAIELFERLVEENPNRNEYWRHLYQAYSYLGMQEKANEAKAKANL